MRINNHLVGPNLPSYLIAEVGLAHDGSLGSAYAFVDATAKTGVNAIKFQTHISSEESSPFEQFRVNVFPQDASRRDYWDRTSFTKQQWLSLADFTRSKGLDFLSSPFSGRAVEWLQDCDVAAWKVASGEVTNYPMIKQMVATGKPLLVSSGMSSWQELDHAVDYIRGLGGELGVFQCTTAYPCPPENWGLSVVSEMAGRYDCPIGLSDHSGTIFPCLGARMLGASIFEFHVIFDHNQFGPDSKASLTFEQTAQLVQGIRSLEKAAANPIDKDVQAKSLAETRKLFAKGLFAACDIPANKSLEPEDVIIRKPLIGLSARDYDSILGQVTKRVIKKNYPIHPEDLN